MKEVISAAFLMTLGSMTVAHAKDIEGQWARGDSKAKVAIAPCGQNMCATNTWIKAGTAKEKAGDKLVMTIMSKSKGSYSGTAFDPQRNLTYTISVTVDTDKMTTRGCIVAGLLCRGISWTRIN